MAELDSYVERYVTNNRRRALTAVVAIVVGTPVLVLGVFSFLILYKGPASGGLLVAGGIIGSGLGVVLMGISLAVQSILWRGEAFTVHENGFVRTRGKKTTIVTWTDIGTITDVSKNNLLAKAFAGDVGCLIRLTDGRKVLINGYTEGAALLIQRITEASGKSA